MQIKNISFEKNTVYLVFRGTNSKGGLIAKEFNVCNKNISHVGIGFLSNDTFMIYHIDTEISNRSDNLFIETLEEFINKDEIDFLRISVVKNIQQEDFFNIKKEIEKSLLKSQYFDMKFELDNKDFYCSEYVIEMLKSTKVKYYQKHKRPINGIIQKVLKKDTLIYYPVDSYEKKHIETVFEWNFKKK